MNTLLLQFSRQIAAGLVLLVAAPMSEGAVLPLDQQEPATAQQQQAQPAQPAAPAAAADAAGQQGTDQASPGFASRSQDVPQQDAQKPVGTAVGPTTKPSGVAGSRPAGAAIAPAKQRRVKSIVIRVGLIVAGAAAAGAVIGLSKESPSRP